MRLLYNILFPVLFLLAAPFYCWKLVRRGNWRVGFAQRFGAYGELTEQLKNQRVIWLHAVSVGEANLAVQLVERLQAADSESVYVVSTTTTTGMGVLQRRLQEGVSAVYYPIDWLPFVKRAFKALNPAAVVLVEAEIWPNLFWEAETRSVPMTLVNARLSGVVPWVSTVWVALPPIVSVPVRGGRASRGGCAPIGIIGHTAGSH